MHRKWDAEANRKWIWWKFRFYFYVFRDKGINEARRDDKTNKFHRAAHSGISYPSTSELILGWVERESEGLKSKILIFVSWHETLVHVSKWLPSAWDAHDSKLTEIRLRRKTVLRTTLKCDPHSTPDCTENCCLCIIWRGTQGFAQGGINKFSMSLRRFKTFLHLIKLRFCCTNNIYLANNWNMKSDPDLAVSAQCAEREAGF